MAEANFLKPVSALTGVAVAGKFGPGKTKGVQIAVCPPRSVVSVTARKDKSDAVSKLIKKHYGLSVPTTGCSNSNNKMAMHWAGPDQWYVTSTNEIYDDLVKQLAGVASVVDQSHGRVTLVISGKNVRDVLAKGTPVDLHPTVFKPGNCALTEMAHIAVHIAEISSDEFEVSFYRGFAQSFWEWLTEMSLEFGYEVKVKT